MGDVAADTTLFPPPSFVQRFIISPLKRLFDAIWHVLAYIVGVILIGGILVNVLISLATTGSPGLADPTSWAISRPLLANPVYSLMFFGGVVCIGVISYLVHLRSHPPQPGPSESLVKEFGLGMVQNVTPTPGMIPFYRATVYIPRHDKAGDDVDEFARKILAAAAIRKDPTRFAEQVGICVTGRKLLGTTRLAWQALKSEISLNTWVFVRWPENPLHYVELWQTLQQRRAKVVLWLDDLSKYQDERNASLIARLPFDLEESRIPFVVIATLHEDEIEEAQVRFGSLLDHLISIRPSDLTSTEANMLLEKLKGAGESIYPASRFDGTPGSIVLAVDRMRDEIYPRLRDEAKAILRAVKLLRSGGVQEYRLDRVVSTARILNPPGHPDWTRGVEALQGAGFLRQAIIDSGRVVLLEPIAEVYLDVAVPEYSEPTSAMEDWPRLQETLVQTQDAYALVRLGNAFRRAGNDDRADECYHSALEYLTRATAEQDWASAQFGLGDVLSRRVEMPDISQSQHRKLLEQAEDAFNSALQVVSRESDPTFWAEIQGRLSGIIRHEATTTVGRRKRVDMLDSAEKKSRDALRILRRETAPEDWATTQQNLGLVLLTHAQFAQDADTRRRMLDRSRDALTASLEVFTRENYAYQWTRLQRALGQAYRLRADASNRPRKDEALKQAIQAYTNSLTVSLPMPLWQPTERAEILNHLSEWEFTLGMLSDGSAREELLAHAAESSRSASEANPNQSVQEMAAHAHAFSAIQYERATIAPEGSRIPLLDEATQVNVETLAQLGRQGQRELRPQIRLDLARLYWARATYGDQSAILVVRKDLEETAKYAEQALEFYTKANAPAEYQQAVKLQRDAKNRAITLETNSANSA